MSSEYRYDDEYDYNPVTDRFIKTGEPRKNNGYSLEGERQLEQFRKDMKDLLNEQKLKELAAERQKQEDKIQQMEMRIEASQARSNAINLARKRYQEKSALYRLFHKRLSYKRAANMTTAEINNLYGGIEDGKGMSR